jgi:hypothetical protein
MLSNWTYRRDRRIQAVDCDRDSNANKLGEGRRLATARLWDLPMTFPEHKMRFTP